MKFKEKTNNVFKKEEICGSMIYFLTKDNEVVYVGQSKQGMNRIYFHKFSKKDFDSFYFINCDIEKLDELESYYILKYLPKYNKSLEKYSKDLISYTNFYYNQYEFNKAPRLNYKEAKEQIIKNKLYDIKFKSFIYLNKTNLNNINQFLTNISLKLHNKKNV